MSGATSDLTSLPGNPKPANSDYPFTIKCYRGCTWSELTNGEYKCTAADNSGVTSAYQAAATTGYTDRFVPAAATDKLCYDASLVTASDDGDSSEAPTGQPTKEPTVKPTEPPTIRPTDDPTSFPTTQPTTTHVPTPETPTPTLPPTDSPTSQPTAKPTNAPTSQPTKKPTIPPTSQPTAKPTHTGMPTTADTVSIAISLELTVSPDAPDPTVNQKAALHGSVATSLGLPASDIRDFQVEVLVESTTVESSSSSSSSSSSPSSLSPPGTDPSFSLLLSAFRLQRGRRQLSSSVVVWVVSFEVVTSLSGAGFDDTESFLEDVTTTLEDPTFAEAASASVGVDVEVTGVSATVGESRDAQSSSSSSSSSKATSYTIVAIFIAILGFFLIGPVCFCVVYCLFSGEKKQFCGKKRGEEGDGGEEANGNGIAII